MRERQQLEQLGQELLSLPLQNMMNSHSIEKHGFGREVNMSLSMRRSKEYCETAPSHLSTATSAADLSETFYATQSGSFFVLLSG